MHDDWKAEVGGKSLGDRVPGVSVVVAAQHTEVGTRSSRPFPFTPAAVVLHIEPARGVVMTRDFVHALAEHGVWIGLETGADASVRRREGLAAVLAQIVPAG